MTSDGYLYFNGTDLSVESSSFKHAQGFVTQLVGTGIIVRNSTFEGGQMGITAPRSAELIGNSFIGSATGVYIQGDGARVESNTFEDNSYAGAIIAGADAIIQKNVFRRSGGGHSALVIDGDGAFVSQNRFEDSPRDGIYVSGDGHTIVDNQFTGTVGHDIFVVRGAGGNIDESQGRVERARMLPATGLVAVAVAFAANMIVARKR